MSGDLRGALLDWLLAATIAVAAVAALAGIDIEVGGLRFRSHSPLRVLVAAAVLLGIRAWMGIGNKGQWLLRLAMLTMVACSVATWFRFLVSTIGGSDSYGYVSASQMLRDGRLSQPVPITEWLTMPNRLTLASPLGWAPAADGSGIVPTFPLGLPIVMAAFDAIAGPGAAFLVSPALALLALAVVFQLTREWCDDHTAWVATAVVAVNPVFVAYAKQPMSDVPATAWMIAATALALRASAATALLAGAAAGAALVTRPVLVIAAAMVPLIAFRGSAPWPRALLASAGVGSGVALQLALQATLFGHPLASGYGTPGKLFSLSFLPTDVAIYASQVWVALGAIWVGGFALGVPRTPAPLRQAVAVIAMAVTLPYLFYHPIDHWETLRFLLPALVPLTVIVAIGLMRVARMAANAYAVAGIIVLLVGSLAARSEGLLRRSSVWDIQSLEMRYPLAGQWLAVNTPPGSIVLANQHSGSVRWYGNRPTLRWDFVSPDQLTPLVREIESRSATVYVVLEGAEVEMFERRFVGAIGQLRVDHLGSLRNVSFRRLKSAGALPAK